MKMVEHCVHSIQRPRASVGSELAQCWWLHARRSRKLGTGTTLGASRHRAGSAAAAGEGRNFGCHSRNRVSSRLSSTAHRTFNSRCAPSADHDIGWRLPIRWLTTLLILDSAGALEILSPFRQAAL